jgi:hypothetical protein
MSERLIGVVILFALSTAFAAPLDRDGAIDVAKRQVKERCKAAMCTFTAKREKNQWHVRVRFTQDKADKGSPGQAIFIIDQNGKVVGRVE